MRFITIVVLFILQSSCYKKQLPDIDVNNVSYTTTEQSVLFFRNVRSFYYQKDIETSTPMELFRWKNLSLSDSMPDLNLIIALNIYRDAAYLILEPTINYTLDSIKHIKTIDSTGNEGIIFIQIENATDHIRLAQQIYNAINHNENLFLILENDSKIPFLEQADRKYIFQKIVRDHLRLTNKW